MKRFSLSLGAISLSLLAAACSGGQDTPPFEADDSLEAQLLGELGAPFVVERRGSAAIMISPLADTRVVAKDPASAEAAVRDLFSRHASAFGAGLAPVSLRLTRAEADGLDGALTVRLVQVLPNTDIEVLGRGAAVDLFADGTMASGAASLADTSVAPAAPRTSAADVERTLRALVATWGAPVDEDADANLALAFVDGPRLVALVAADGALTLRWRASFSVAHTGFEAWVDADTGAVLEARQAHLDADGEIRSTKAWSFRSYPIARALGNADDGTKLAIDVTRDADGEFTLVRPATANRSRIDTIEQTGLDQNNPWPRWTPIRSRTPDEFLGQFPVTVMGAPGGSAVDVHHNAMTVDRVYRELTGAGPTRDGRMIGLLHANDDFVQIRGGARVFRADGSRFNPSYDPVVNLVRFGDGGYLTARNVWLVPMGVPLDVAGHEWTHAFVTRKTGLSFVGEDGALQEVFGDVLGKLIALRESDSRPYGFGAGLRADGAFVRNFQDPTLTLDFGADGFRPMPAHQSDMDADCAARGSRDQGCVHFNAGPGDHAFYLMLAGGKARSSSVLVSKPLARSQLEQLWFHSAATAFNVQDLKQTPFGKLGLVAIQQVDFARHMGAEARRTVACAWRGVGLITPSQLQARSIACNAADGTERLAPSDCHGRADGYYCSEGLAESATLCRGGQIAGGHQCAGGEVCVPLDATRSARLGASGAPECARTSP